MTLQELRMINELMLKHSKETGDSIQGTKVNMISVSRRGSMLSKLEKKHSRTRRVSKCTILKIREEASSHTARSTASSWHWESTTEVQAYSTTSSHRHSTPLSQRLIKKRTSHSATQKQSAEFTRVTNTRGNEYNLRAVASNYLMQALTIWTNFIKY